MGTMHARGETFACVASWTSLCGCAVCSIRMLVRLWRDSKHGRQSIRSRAAQGTYHPCPQPRFAACRECGLRIKHSNGLGRVHARIGGRLCQGCAPLFCLCMVEPPWRFRADSPCVLDTPLTRRLPTRGTSTFSCDRFWPAAAGRLSAARSLSILSALARIFCRDTLVLCGVVDTPTPRPRFRTSLCTCRVGAQTHVSSSAVNAPPSGLVTCPADFVERALGGEATIGPVREHPTRRTSPSRSRRGGLVALRLRPCVAHPAGSAVSCGAHRSLMLPHRPGCSGG